MRHVSYAGAWDAPSWASPADAGVHVNAAQQAYLQSELEEQRAQTERLNALQAQLAECMSDVEAEKQLELHQKPPQQARQHVHGWLPAAAGQPPSQHPRAESEDDDDEPPPPPPYDAPSFSTADSSGGSVEAWDSQQQLGPRVWRRRSSEYSALSADPASFDGARAPRRRNAPRVLNPVLDGLVAEYSREWEIPLEDAEDGIFPEFIDLEVLSDSVLAAKMQERKRFRRQRHRAAKDKARAAARILSKQRLRQTWAIWLVEHRDSSGESKRRARHKALEQKLRGRFAQRHEASALAAWKATIVEVNLQRAKLRRAVARILHVHLVAAWHVWHGQYTKYCKGVEVLTKVFGRLRLLKVSVTFTTWVENASWLRRAKNVGNRVMGRLRNMRFRALFATWELMVVEIKRMRTVMRSATLRLGNLSLSASWQRWYGHVARSFKTRMAAQMMLKRLANFALSSAFSSWRDWYRGRKREKGLVRKVVARIQRQTLSGALAVWEGTVRAGISQRHETERVRAAAERMVRQWIKRTLAEAMRLWLTVTENILRQRCELRKVALRWQDRHLSNAWLMLCEGCSAARVIREDVVGQARDEAKRSAAAEKVVSLLCGRRGLETCRHIMILWIDWASVSGRLHRLLSKGEGNFKGKVLRGSFEAWSVVTTDRRSLRRLGERLTGKLSMHAIKSALLQWHRGASMAAATRRAEGKLRKFGLSQESLRGRAIFKAWADIVSYRKSLEKKLYVGLHRMAKGAIGAAFTTWEETVGREARNRKAVAASIKKIRLKGAILCFEVWACFTLDRLEEQAKMKKAANRLFKAMLVKGFGAWREYNLVRGRLEKLLGKGSMKLDERREKCCFAAWTRHTHVAQYFRLASEKIARKVSRRVVWEVLTGWCDVVMEKKRLDGMLRKCAKRLGHAAVGAVFRRWLADVSVDESKHHAAAKFAMGATSTRLKVVFQAWAGLSGSAATEKKRRQELLNNSLRRLLARQKTLSFERWLELFDEAQRRKEVLATAVRRLKSLGVARAFKHWQSVLLTKKRRQARAVHSLLIADTRLRLKRSGGAFRRWRMWLQLKKETRGKIRKGLQICARVSLKFYMSAWSVQAQKGRRAASALRKMLDWQAAMAFAVWVGLVEAKHIRLQQLLASLTSWGDGFILSRVFHRWADHVQELLDEEANRFRPALVGLSPNLAARYREIVGESEFVQHPAVSPGLRDHSPRPTSPLRHIDVRGSSASLSDLRGSNDSSLRGSVSSPALTLKSAGVGSLDRPPGTSSPGGWSYGGESPVEDLSLEQLARSPCGMSAPSSSGGSHMDSVTAAAISRSRALAQLQDNQPQPQHGLRAGMGLKPAMLSDRPLPPTLAPRHRWQSRGSAVAGSASSSVGGMTIVSASVATTASTGTLDGYLPFTSAVPSGGDRTSHMTGAQLWLHQRRSGENTPPTALGGAPVSGSYGEPYSDPYSDVMRASTYRSGGETLNPPSGFY